MDNGPNKKGQKKIDKEEKKSIRMLNRIRLMGDYQRVTRGLDAAANALAQVANENGENCGDKKEEKVNVPEAKEEEKVVVKEGAEPEASTSTEHKTRVIVVSNK